MSYAIATTTVIPLRAQPNHQSEMVSQLLFGEVVRIIENYKKWVKIFNAFDNYEGWVDLKQLTIISEEEANHLLKSVTFYTKEIVTNVYDLDTKQEVRLLFGSHLPGYNNGKINIANHDYIIRESPLSLRSNSSIESIVLNARQFIGAPYLWGGKSPFGVDCSGFVQQVFKVCGIDLPRDASDQAIEGELVSFIGDAKEGDLAFFDNELGQITHVGIILKNQKIIHAFGQVRVDIVDHNGIFNEATNDYSHNLRLIKRFF